VRRGTAFPFLVIPDEAVSLGTWMIGDPGQPLLPAGETLDGWDYERDLEVAVDVAIDFETAGTALQISPEDLRLAVFLRAGTGSGTIPRRMDLLSADRLDQARSAANLSGTLTSSQLSGRLLLDLTIVLEMVPASRGAISPGWRGARLWDSRKDILLEDGGDSRFPIELLGFSKAFAGQPHAYAPWHLDWQSGDFHADFGAAVRVYVNSDIPDIRDRFVIGDALTLQAILGDVMSQMIGLALDHEDCADLLSECASNSVGHQIRNWMDLAFPGQPIEAIRAGRDHAPGRFRSTILAAAEMGDAP